jgi:hypothetical protein
VAALANRVVRDIFTELWEPWIEVEAPTINEAVVKAKSALSAKLAITIHVGATTAPSFLPQHRAGGHIPMLTRAGDRHFRRTSRR